MSAPRYANPDALLPPVGQYTNVCVIAAGVATAHIAGQLPIGEDGGLVAEDFPAQAAFVFDNLAAALESAGSSLAHATIIRTYLVDENDLPAFRTARAEAFERHRVTIPPPATTVVVRSLVGGGLIELEAVGAVSGDR